MTNKYILTDCDGVLLDWRSAFMTWMTDQGYDIINPNYPANFLHEGYGITHREISKLVNLFCNSSRIGFLEPLEHSVENILAIYKETGYKFVVITALGDDICTQRLRMDNLIRIYGNDIFQEFIFTSHDKSEPLDRFKDNALFFVEDKFSNATLSLTFGIQSFIIKQPWNRHRINQISKSQIIEVDDWRDIRKHINERT